MRTPFQRSTLESLPRPLLVRMLAPFAEALEKKGLDPSRFAEANGRVEEDRALVQLYRELVSHKTGPFARLCELFSNVEALASDAGSDALSEALLVLDLAPLPLLPPLERACFAALESPAAFRHARASVSADRLDRYVEYDAVGDAPQRGKDDAERIGHGLADVLRPWLAAHDQTPYVDVLVLERRGEVVIEVVHGTRERRAEVLSQAAPDAAYGRTLMSLRDTKRDYLVLDEQGRLLLKCCGVAERNLYRETMSQLVSGSKDHFSPRPLLRLSTFLQGVPEPTEGLDAVTVTKIACRLGTSTGSFSDPRGVGWLLSLAADWIEGADVREVRLSLVPEGKKRAKTLTLTVPSSLSYDHDEEWEAVVRRYLVASGVLVPWRADLTQALGELSSAETR